MKPNMCTTNKVRAKIILEMNVSGQNREKISFQFSYLTIKLFIFMRFSQSFGPFYIRRNWFPPIKKIWNRQHCPCFFKNER